MHMQNLPRTWRIIVTPIWRKLMYLWRRIFRFIHWKSKNRRTRIAVKLVSLKSSTRQIVSGAVAGLSVCAKKWSRLMRRTALFRATWSKTEPLFSSPWDLPTQIPPGPICAHEISLSSAKHLFWGLLRRFFLSGGSCGAVEYEIWSLYDAYLLNNVSEDGRCCPKTFALPLKKWIYPRNLFSSGARHIKKRVLRRFVVIIMTTYCKKRPVISQSLRQRRAWGIVWLEVRNSVNTK